ncbi:Hsp20/alpha crystallin family protein [Streptomyces cynarae]|uniref:Hsp20/alpha crystallin family protein n=1 Tax=Streptomyces cynarae TaxID=2981134 RepID=UPI0028BF48F2|nr:Hsp20/alpha crystallin family protein [Streptomyces cynarae]
MQLPGVKSKDIDIEANGQDLVVTGEIKEKERKGVPHRGTRRTGAFEHRLRLPGGRTPRTSQWPVCNGPEPSGASGTKGAMR